MNIRTLFLLVSLFANITLATLIFYTRTRTNASTPSSNSDISKASEKIQKLGTLANSIQSDDHALYLKNLISAGIPESAAREIVRLQIAAKTRAKYASLFREKDFPYWQARFPYRTSEEQKATNEYNTELNSLYKEILGDRNFKNDERYREAMRMRFGNVSDDRILAALKLEEDYAKRSKNIPKASTPGEIVASRQLRDALRSELQAEMGKLFTPEELLEQSMRNSMAAGNMRGDMRFFNITEKEFRALFPLYETELKIHAQESRKLPIGAYNEEKAAAYEAIETKTAEERKTQIRALLGEERYADYLQATDPDQNKLNRIVKRLELPISAAREVVSVQDDVVQRAASIEADSTLSNEQRAEHYAALAQEATARITRTLGPRGYSAYRVNSKNWTQSLEAGRPPQK